MIRLEIPAQAARRIELPEGAVFARRGRGEQCRMNLSREQISSLLGDLRAAHEAFEASRPLSQSEWPIAIAVEKAIKRVEGLLK